MRRYGVKGIPKINRLFDRACLAEFKEICFMQIRHLYLNLLMVKVFSNYFKMDDQFLACITAKLSN